MKTTNVLIFIFLMSFVSCRSYYYKVKTEPASVSMEENLEGDAAIESLIAPYKAELEAEMNEVVGKTMKPLTKEKPESTLGNFMSDAILAEAIAKGFDADFALVNYGGIRVLALPVGQVSRGNIFELMPFENTLVRLELDGVDLLAAFEKMAGYGGWPVSKEVKYSFDKNGNLKQVLIGGEPINPTQKYRIILSDFVANGGDNMAMFIEQPRDDVGLLFRDALLQHIDKLSAKKELINANIEGRAEIIE